MGFFNTKCSDMTIGQALGYVATVSLLSVGVAVVSTAAVEWITNHDWSRKEEDAEEEELVTKKECSYKPTFSW